MTNQHTTTSEAHQPGGPLAPASARFADTIQILIMLAVATMAGAASFTHVHDWTMHNSPPRTGDWFGWANAMVSELIPIAAGLEIRRRRRHGQPIGFYPILLITAAVALSLAGQFAEAKPGPSGWLISAIPALGFLALVKLALTPPPPSTTATATPNTSASAPPTPTAAEPTVPVTTDVPDPADAEPAHDAEPPPVTVPAHLLPTARFALVQHEQATGHAITADQLAARMSVTPAVAAQLLTVLDQPDASIPTARINGAPVAGGRP